MEDTIILIIEDEPTINRILKKYFEKEGYMVLSALDGAKGLELINKNNVDIVCLDIMLPSISGWNVAKTIREISDTPIFMMSALSEEEDILKGFSLQVDDYITKPFPPSVLVAKIKNFIKRVEIERNQTSLNGVYNIEGINFEVNTLEQNNKMKELLTHDELTKIANRRYLDLHLKAMVKKAEDFHMDNWCIVY